ncbi:MAG: L-type lectin-domain containing protein [Acidobacteriota bacterium]
MKSIRYVSTVRLWVVLAGVMALPGYAAPISLPTLQLVGTSQLLAPGLLRLTPNFDVDPAADPPAGAAWTPTTMNVANPFSVSFSFRMSDATGQTDPADGSGGDGIAFVIQNDFRGTSAIGRGAGGMGFMGIFDSVAVMFDTYQNNYAYGDPNGNYVAVNTRGTDFNVPHHFCTAGQLTTDPALPPDLPGVTCTSNPSLAMATVASPLFGDGAIHNALIGYNTGQLSVTLDGILILVVSLDLPKTLNLANGSDAFLGFTAGTRFSYQNQDILSFSVNPTPEPGTALTLLGGLALIGTIGVKRNSSARRGPSSGA